jgi:hypothetical protein
VPGGGSQWRFGNESSSIDASYRPCTHRLVIVEYSSPVGIGRGNERGFGLISHFNVAWGQRYGTNPPEVLSHQGERSVHAVRRVGFNTRPKTDAPRTAFFRVQACHRPLGGTSKCSGWSPIIKIYLGYNELTAY